MGGPLWPAFLLRWTLAMEVPPPDSDLVLSPETEDPWLHVVLYQPEIPHNTGSVGRTCVALGAKLWLVRPLGFRIDDRNLKRSGLDYWAHLDWETVDDWEDLINKLPETRMWLFTKFGDRSYLEVDYQRGDTLVFGRESTGLPDKLIEEAVGRRLRVPTTDNVRSLNLSNTVAIAGYEALRQTRLV